MRETDWPSLGNKHRIDYEDIFTNMSCLRVISPVHSEGFLAMVDGDIDVPPQSPPNPHRHSASASKVVDNQLLVQVQDKLPPSCSCHSYPENTARITSYTCTGILERAGSQQTDAPAYSRVKQIVGACSLQKRSAVIIRFTAATRWATVI